MNIAGLEVLTANVRKKSVLLAGFTCSLFITCLALSPSLSMKALAQATSTAGQPIKYPSGDTSLDALIAKPSGSGKHPAAIIVHDDIGFNNAVKDALRSLTAAGFVAFAPNLASRAGSTSPNGPRGFAKILSEIPSDQTVEDLKAAYEFLAKDPAVDPQKISAIGFGWGGWRVFKLAEEVSTLHRGVVFYGTTPVSDNNLSKIKTPIMGQYAQYDFSDTGSSVWTGQVLGKNFSSHIYADANRGFFVGDGEQPAGAPKGNARASTEAWASTLAFLQH